MKRLCIFLLALLMSVLLLPACGQAPGVNDQAGVLSPGLTTETNQLFNLISKHLDINLSVQTRHFLGGQDVQAYTDKLLSQADDDSLVVLAMIIGEERYALSLGDKARQFISRDTADNLLSRHFRDAYLTDRAYDKALAVFLLALSEQLQIAKGTNLPANELLYAYTGEQRQQAPQASPVPQKESSWLDSIFADADKASESARQYGEDAQQAQKGKREGLSLFQIAIIGFVLFKIFGKKQPGNKGCGPLGWIFGTWGISKIFGWRR